MPHGGVRGGEGSRGGEGRRRQGGKRGRERVSGCRKEGEGGRVRVRHEGVDEKRRVFLEMTEFSNFFFFMLK